MEPKATNEMQARLRQLGARAEALNLILGEVAASGPDVDLVALRGDLANMLKSLGMVDDRPAVVAEAIKRIETSVRAITDRLAGLLENGAITPRAGLSITTLRAMLAMMRDDAD